MCVAIAQGIGAKRLTRKQWDNGWASNPDGGGYAFIDEDNNIVVKKSMESKPLWNDYKNDFDAYGGTSPFLVHMRIATHGDPAIGTTHPFIIRPGLAFAHNGIISQMDELTDNHTSDTMAFGANVLADLPAGWGDKPGIVELVEDYLGSKSKLIFLVAEEGWEGKLYILNEDLGHWDDLNWFSNRSCEYGKTKTFSADPRKAGGGSYFRTGWDDWTWDSYDDWFTNKHGKERESSFKKHALGSQGQKYELASPTPKNDKLAPTKQDPRIRGTMPFISPSEPSDEDLVWTATDYMAAGAADLAWMEEVAYDEGVHCIVCTGITKCFCDHLCIECCETVYECDCSKGWVSMSSLPESRAYQYYYEKRNVIPLKKTKTVAGDEVWV